MSYYRKDGYKGDKWYPFKDKAAVESAILTQNVLNPRYAQKGCIQSLLDTSKDDWPLSKELIEESNADITSL